MSTPKFLDADKSQRFAALLMDLSGESKGTREISHFEEIKDTIAIDATHLGVWDPKEHAEIKATAQNRALSVWDGDVSFAFVPGPKCFGRIVTLHSAWVPPGHANPATAGEMRKLPGYEVCVVGGVGDPQFNKGWRNIPFSAARHRVLISNTLKIVDPMRLVWYVSSVDVGDKKGDGAFFFLRVLGEVEVFGSFV